MATDLFREGQYVEAEQLARSAVEIWNKVDPKYGEADLAWNTLAAIALHDQDNGSALRFAHMALDTYQRRSGRNSVQLAAYQRTLALAKEYGGDPKGATNIFQHSLSELKDMRPPLPLRIGILEDYAELVRHMGQKRKARSLENQANKELAQFAKQNSFRYTVQSNELRGRR